MADARSAVAGNADSLLLLGGLAGIAGGSVLGRPVVTGVGAILLFGAILVSR